MNDCPLNTPYNVLEANNQGVSEAFLPHTT